MAAVLIRRGTGLCCIHRVFWRSQTAAFSSKPSDRKQQRRTHIKKAKPQPAVDVSELLEKLFSLRRPSVTPPAAKARPAKASSDPPKPPKPPKPPSSSSLNVSSSSVPPLSKTEAAMSVFPAAPSLDVRSLSKVTSDSSTPASSSDAAAVEYQTKTGTIETKVETASEPAVMEINTEISSIPAASVEPLIELTLEPSVEHILSPVDTQQVTSAVVDPVELPTKDSDPDMVDLSHKQEPLIETEIESVEVSNSPVQTPETRSAVEAIVAQKETKNTDSGLVDISHGAAGEPLIEVTIESSVEHIETPEVTSAVVDPVELPTKDTDIKEPLIESPVEESYSLVETPQTRRAIVEGPVEPTIENPVAQKETKNTDSGVIDISHGATVEASVEDTSTESRSAVAEGSAHSVPTNCTDSRVEKVSHSAGDELLIETPSTSPVSDAAGEEDVMLEPLTLAKVKLEPEETRNDLEKEADVSPNEKKVDPSTKEDVAVFEETTEAETLVSESSDAIETKTSVLLEAMPGSEQGPPGEQDEGQERAEQQQSRGEALTLESVTLADLQASLGALESESLTEAARYLEREAEIAAGEKRREVDDTAASEETLSLPEAAALSGDVQIDVLMEELLFILPGRVAEGQTGQEILKAADVDTAVTVNDDVPASPALKEVQQEVEEPAEALGIEEGEGTQTDLDPVQRLFLEKIKEYNTQRLNRGLLEEPEYRKYLSEETAKLQRLHGGGDLNSFPRFTFTEPQMDQDSK